MTKPKNTGVPTVENGGEDLATRPMGFDELPRQFRIDHELATIAAHHARIEKAIRMFWGHNECVEYLQMLILDGTDASGHSRAGFKPEVLSALMNLITLHEES